MAAAKFLLKHYPFFLCIVLFFSCKENNTLFKKIDASHSGIYFSNTVIENDSINPIDLEFLYNGGGVAAGDFNNDGLTDLYFTAGMTENKMYLNKGNFQFQDITQISGTGGLGRWCNGVSTIDINNDGLLDLYICATIKSTAADRTNLLYINKGLNQNGMPVFVEKASEYGLADTSFSVQSAFFDYDNDGDLDMYLVTTKLAKRESVSFSGNKKASDLSDVDKLFRNDWNEQLGHPVYTDVSKQAGINEAGFGLGIAIADINKDGWKDVYVTNDFFGSDLLYINNQNGTFLNQTNKYFKHTSQNAMGNDINDINNDGLADIIAVDMNPEDNYRKKKNMSGNNYYLYQNMLYSGLMLQYVRNTLQLNLGNTILVTDSPGHPIFADISFYSGVAETDWSWNALMSDMDNDGNRDILITNGYPRDVTDHDFGAFRKDAGAVASKQDLIDEIPQVKISNYAFKNQGNLQFENITARWGFSEPTFSNGAVSADLDNDGDLDYVINNINQTALVYKNKCIAKENKNANYVSIGFRGSKNNINGIGTWVEIYYDKGKKQVYENSPYRGYLSTLNSIAFFGLGNVTKIDSVLILWPGNIKQKLQDVTANQHLIVDVKNANLVYSWQSNVNVKERLFVDITQQAGIKFQHQQTDFIDFDIERLLPHKLSQYGPGLAAGDIDGNGLDDIFIGGGGDFYAKYFLQQFNGKFVEKSIVLPVDNDTRRPENQGVLLFDADNDGDLDLYLANGSNRFSAGTKNYQDHFFINNGKGEFYFDSSAYSFPVNYTSKSCVKAADYDNDGDLDLFIGGRCLPGSYPMPVNSFIYRNDSKNGSIKFTDVSIEVAPVLKNIGMVSDAIWTDFDNDNATDLIITGEWMPLTFLKNTKGKFSSINKQTGIQNKTGWFNSITGADIDKDGDTDYIIGNLGLNSFYRASENYPVNVYSKDFDANGKTEPIVTMYMKSPDGSKKEYTAFNRDDIVSQLPGMKKFFLTYKDFANAAVQDLFKPDVLSNAYKLHANYFSNCWIKNNGHGKFDIIPLPAMAQLAPVYGIVTGDFNSDGNIDLCLSGNDFGNEPGNGRYDAFCGLVLSGDGTGNFKPLTAAESGLSIPGDGKALVILKGRDNKVLIAASENKGPLRIFKSQISNGSFIKLGVTDKAVYYHYKNGKKQKQELYHGSSFLSQGLQVIQLLPDMQLIQVLNNNGQLRDFYHVKEISESNK
jgi:enediyne biosynthesis protein E4